jgi:predicted membrane-bound spermidine synthase
MRPRHLACKGEGPASPGVLTLCGLLFTSGAASLVYQVLWIKQLSLVVGIDVYAVTTAVAAFFGGLALGSLLFGGHVDQMPRPLRLYAVLELGIAILGVLATLALAHAAPLFAAAEDRVGVLAWAIPFCLVGAPALLMGGTLPALVRAQAPLPGQVSRAGGSLYSASTAGAITGALLTPFALLPLLGVRGAAFAAAAANVTLAVVAAGLDPRMPLAIGAIQPSVPHRARSSQARLALGLYALAGGIALGYEVVWSQAIVQFTSTRGFAFSVVLATYLTGLFVGSALYAPYADRIRDRWGVFGLLISAAGLAGLFAIGALGSWLPDSQSRVGHLVFAATSSDLAAMCARFAVAAVAIIFVPTVLLGAAFPAALRLVVDVETVGRGVGAVAAVNTIGGIVGSLATGFVLIPALGLVHTLGVLAMGAAAVGMFAVLRGAATQRGSRCAALAIALATVFTLAVIPSAGLATLLVAARGGRLMFYSESPGGTVAVVEQQTERRSFRRLYIQGVSNSGDLMPSRRYMRLQALLPLIIHRGEPRTALVIGLGTGITTGALLRYPRIERRVCAELLPAVVRAAPLFEGNFGAVSDPRLEIHLRDGRRELRRGSERYDVITLEPPPPSAAGVVNLYSRDFYELARTRLGPGGLLAQWWPLATQNDEDSRALVKSFLDAFPHAALWTTEFHEMLLMGSSDPIELDVMRISARFNQSEVASALREVGISTPAALLATWIVGRAGLERYVGDALPVTDDHPSIEYAAWLRPGEFQRVLPKVLALRADPPLLSADERFRVAVTEERERLLGFYGAGLRAYAGEREQWANAFGQVLKGDRENRYYRWFVGGGG